MATSRKMNASEQAAYAALKHYEAPRDALRTLMYAAATGHASGNGYSVRHSNGQFKVIAR